MTKLLLITLLFPVTLLANPTSFLPENDLSIPAYNSNSLLPRGISELEFNSVLDRVETVYKPIVAAHGGTLIVNRKWTMTVVNANAQRVNDEWHITMFGGMARHKHMTADGFAIIACHELGHHLAGAPLYDRGQASWASTEGQSDYFATAKCLRRIWRDDDNIANMESKVIPEEVQKQCVANWRSNADQNLCLRIGVASHAVGKLLGSLVFFGFGRQPRFETPDRRIVRGSSAGHPKAQCRLDTYFQGSLCNESYNKDFSATDETIGACHASRGDHVGLRPTCWFKSAL